MLFLFNGYKTDSGFNIAKTRVCLGLTHGTHDAPCPAVTEGLRAKRRDNDVWGTRAPDAELEVLRHVVADSTKCTRKNWADCTGKLQGYVG